MYDVIYILLLLFKKFFIVIRYIYLHYVATGTIIKLLRVSIYFSLQRVYYNEIFINKIPIQFLFCVMTKRNFHDMRLINIQFYTYKKLLLNT